ncbi:MAG: hypothetical protein ACTS2F_14350 [Thainema sp.]
MKQLQSTTHATLTTSFLKTPLVAVSMLSAALSSALSSVAVAYPSIGLEFDLAPAPTAESSPSDSAPGQSTPTLTNRTVQAPTDNASSTPATADEDIPQFSESTYQPDFPISPERLPVPDYAGNPPLASADSRTFAAVPPTPPYLEPSWLFAQQPSTASQDASPDDAATATQPSETDADSSAIADGTAPESDKSNDESNTEASTPEKSSLPALGSRPSIGFEIGQNQQVTVAAVPPDLISPPQAKSTTESPAEESPKSSASDQESEQTPEPLPSNDLDPQAENEAKANSGTETKPISRTDQLFAGKADSLVARAIGHAEGTRTISGEHTPAYYGHNDPGNGKWNLGSFSYQHGASSPEVADELQLQRLQEQYQTLQQQAQQLKLDLSLAEDLNGLDLANQAPRAALGEAGYLARLAEAQTMGLRGSDAILWARTRAFLDPDTQQWNAPGLGNTLTGISRDQERRMTAIQQILETAPASISVHPVILTPNGSATPVAPSTVLEPEPSPDKAFRPTSTAQPQAASPSQLPPKRNLPRLSASRHYASPPAHLAARSTITDQELRSHIHIHSPAQPRTRTDVIERIFAFDASA